MDSLSPLSGAPQIPLPPMPARGAKAVAPSAEEFRQMLATQGLPVPATAGAPSEAEARITAAQIAGKANVNAGLKRGRVMAGMSGPPQLPPTAPAGRFMPLRQGPQAARVFTAPPAQNATNSIAGLRATTKFAPGPVGSPNLAQAVPAVAHSLKRTPTDTAPSAAETTVPEAGALHSYGVEAAARRKSGVNRELPPWFEGAVTSAMDKYQTKRSGPSP